MTPRPSACATRSSTSGSLYFLSFWKLRDPSLLQAYTFSVLATTAYSHTACCWRIPFRSRGSSRQVSLVLAGLAVLSLPSFRSAVLQEEFRFLTPPPHLSCDERELWRRKLLHDKLLPPPDKVTAQARGALFPSSNHHLILLAK